MARATLIPLAEAAAELGLSPSTLRAQVARGSLRATKMGQAWFVTAAEVARYRDAHLGVRTGGPRPKAATK